LVHGGICDGKSGKFGVVDGRKWLLFFLDGDFGCWLVAPWEDEYENDNGGNTKSEDDRSYDDKRKFVATEPSGEAL